LSNRHVLSLEQKGEEEMENKSDDNKHRCRYERSLMFVWD